MWQTDGKSLWNSQSKTIKPENDKAEETIKAPPSAALGCNSFCLVLRCVRKKLPDAATVIRMSAYVYKKIAERKSMHKKQEKGKYWVCLN